ncbi:tetratricopeptide (TPR) repeat protein [Bradyrhizobium sp. USDA 3315]
MQKKEADLGPLILEAGLLSLESARSDRDEAERTLQKLAADPRAGEDDKLNAAFTLVGIAQRRGDHRSALSQLDAISVKKGSMPAWHVMELRAVSLRELGYYDEAAALFDQLMSEPHVLKSKASGWWQLEAGKTYHFVDRIDDAIRVTKLAVRFFEANENIEHLTRAQSNLAIMMLKSSNPEEVAEGERRIEAASDVKISIGDAEGASTNFSQLSLHYFYQNRFEKAIAYGRKDLYLSRLVGNDRATAATLGNMAMIYLRAGQLSEARASAREAAEIGERLNNPDVTTKMAGLLKMIEEAGRDAGQRGIAIGKSASCACGSGEKYVDCCGRADHEPVALRMPIGGLSEDVGEINEALKGTGLSPLGLDYAMRQTEESRRRVSWAEMRGHQGWFEIFELPDMANIHLNAAEALAKQADEHGDAIDEPIACAMLSVSALEAFINSTVYFASEAAKSRSITLPPELLTDAFAYQRHTELTQKWDALGQALCTTWPPPAQIWSNFVRLVHLRNELVHYKAEGFVRVAPAEKHPPEHLRNLPPEIVIRDIPTSWPMRLLTPSFARWSVAVANDLIRHFRSHYRYALPSLEKGQVTE